jgi:hypothetical protein
MDIHRHLGRRIGDGVSSYLPFPEELAGPQKKLINHVCFLYVIIALLHYDKIGRDHQRVSKLRRFLKEFPARTSRVIPWQAGSLKRTGHLTCMKCPVAQATQGQKIAQIWMFGLRREGGDYVA